MQKYASTVRALNSEGVYIRNQKDMVRIEYSLFKGLQKLATTPPDKLSPEEGKMLEEGKKNSQAKMKTFLEASKKKMDKYARKKLSKLGGFGVTVTFKGPLHKGDLSFKITNNYLNLRGEVLDLKGFEAFVADAKKQKKSYVKYLDKVTQEVEKLMNYSSLVYTGKGNLPKEAAPTKIQKYLKLYIQYLDIGANLAPIFAICVFLFYPGPIGIVSALLYLLGAPVWKWFSKSLKEYGFKNTLSRIRLNVEQAPSSLKDKMMNKKAGHLPSLDYQLGILSSYTNH